MRLIAGLRSILFRFLFSGRFGAFGRSSRIVAPIAIEHPENIFIGDDVYVAAATALSASPQGPGQPARLSIGSGSKLGKFNHIYATRRVEIGRKVLTANGVYISDNLHGYTDPDVAVLDQAVVQLSETVIGDGTWIGHNACVYGVTVGRNCVIGANAVVTRDLPDYSVAVGAPARVVKRYDREGGEWRRTRPDGTFCDQNQQEGATGES